MMNTGHSRPLPLFESISNDHFDWVIKFSASCLLITLTELN